MTKSFCVAVMVLSAAVLAGQNRLAHLSLEEIATQVAALQREVRELKAESLRLRIAAMERDLQEAVSTRIQLNAQMFELQNEIQGLDEELRQPLDSQSYASLAENRSRLIENRALILVKEQQAAQHRETEVNRSLESERRKLQALFR